ncbi:hypothetical protein F4813DRAFT_389355 [Daldinia decipiens]|uniref:uncharacterized protein n=1 Tax=Daldinia decipiens TaxID=326647 RepID=UPI0020C25ED1|nr:uncharacterized protein F4813DRAFT_389355 [Daldinia decipiens]KAI1657620.1 hypothetical protein F4813DRAFT_389355 [Daldinia decipiens]
MIFEACDPTSRQALAQTCHELRNAGWDFRLQNVKVTSTPSSLVMDLAILEDHTETEIVRTHTTLNSSIHIAITVSSSQSTHSPDGAEIYRFGIPGLISAMISLIGEMQRLNELKITIGSTGPVYDLTALYENTIHEELEYWLDDPVSYNSLTIRLKGFTSFRVIHFARMFPELQHLEVGSNCLKQDPSPSNLVNLPPLKSLGIYIQQPDIGGVETLRNIHSTYPLLENFVIEKMPDITWNETDVMWELRNFMHLRKLEIAKDWYYDPDD